MGFRLTERDERLIKHLSLFKFLSTSDIQCLEFPCYRVACYRISKLTEGGLIKTSYPGITRYKQGVHCLTKSGRELAIELGFIPQGLKITNYTTHFEGVNSILIPMYKNNFFQTFQREFNVKFISNDKPYTIQSDIRLLINNKHYFLEYETGSIHISFFRQKIQTLEEYMKSGLYKNSFNDFPIVLIVNDKYEKYLDLLVKESRVPIPYLITTPDEIKNNPYGEIWLSIPDLISKKEERRVSLVKRNERAESPQGNSNSVVTRVGFKQFGKSVCNA